MHPQEYYCTIKMAHQSNDLKQNSDAASHKVTREYTNNEEYNAHCGNTIRKNIINMRRKYIILHRNAAGKDGS